jgi:hypothetical protein
MYISEKYKYLKALLMLELQTNVLKSYSKVCIYIKFDTIFVGNKTHHASHKNSAPGWVFDFYGGHIS